MPLNTPCAARQDAAAKGFQDHLSQKIARGNHRELWQGLLDCGNEAIVSARAFHEQRQSTHPDPALLMIFAQHWVMAMSNLNRLCEHIHEHADRSVSPPLSEKSIRDNLRLIRNAIAHRDERITGFMQDGQRAPKRPLRAIKDEVAQGALKRRPGTRVWEAYGDLTIVGMTISGDKIWAPLALVNDCLISNTSNAEEPEASIRIRQDTASILCRALGLLDPV